MFHLLVRTLKTSATRSRIDHRRHSETEVTQLAIKEACKIGRVRLRHREQFVHPGIETVGCFRPHRELRSSGRAVDEYEQAGIIGSDACVFDVEDGGVGPSEPVRVEVRKSVGVADRNSKESTDNVERRDHPDGPAFAIHGYKVMNAMLRHQPPSLRDLRILRHDVHGLRHARTDAPGVLLAKKVAK